ncbi:hypothetical protein AL053_06260 [Pseudomonas savastanoi pv. fraxini]|nr:Ferrichrome-iron receptor [Pseudomonas savastanoi pv. fraxini]KWS65378.1 hypothetical protein AL053_06260 [Pseudomonas savastanoi pv. fraxini]RMR70020.1 Ferrichrome-iron receptor [Pseudomonas savastanoi pv. fraxini]RMR71682.1 Ferrichrome-iron receptor [Pseudomonas savastanoi pv. fraxini]RMR76577.1 Ferrichrome-iron receptor [Pseudomonas savastanoi pv. fraxini]
MHFHKRRPFYLSLTPLAMIIPLTVGGVSASWVSTASATDASALTHRFSIEKGPLTGQLVRFAQQAGIELAGNAAYTDGKVGPGLDGNYSVTEGLTVLLAGSGIFAAQQSNGSYTLVASESMELRATQVEANSDRSTSYQPTGASSILHSDRSTLEVPQVVRHPQHPDVD